MSANNNNETDLPRCAAITKAGKGPRCANPPLKEKTYCGMHKSQEPKVAEAAAPQKQVEKKNTKTVEKKTVQKQEEKKVESNELVEDGKILFPLPKEDKDSTNLCRRQKGKDNKVCSIRAKFRCSADCPTCEGEAFCKRCWDAVHPKAALITKEGATSEGKVTKARAVAEEDVRCSHQLKNGKGQCTAKWTGEDANGAKSCGRHGGPKATPGASSSKRPTSTSKAVSGDGSIPLDRMWKIRTSFSICDQKGCGKQNCGKETIKSTCYVEAFAMKWLDDFIELNSKSAPAENSYSDHLDLLYKDSDVAFAGEVIQILMDNFGRENMQWIFDNLKRYANKSEKIDSVWKAAAETYEIKLEDDEEPKNNVSSASRSTGNTLSAKNALSRYKKNVEAKEVDQKVIEKVTNKLQELNQDDEDDESIDEEEAALANGEYEPNEE